MVQKWGTGNALSMYSTPCSRSPLGPCLRSRASLSLAVRAVCCSLNYTAHSNRPAAAVQHAAQMPGMSCPQTSNVAWTQFALSHTEGVNRRAPWNELFSEEGQRYYYADTASGETSWDAPLHFRANEWLLDAGAYGVDLPTARRIYEAVDAAMGDRRAAEWKPVAELLIMVIGPQQTSTCAVCEGDKQPGTASLAVSGGGCRHRASTPVRAWMQNASAVAPAARFMPCAWVRLVAAVPRAACQ